MGRSDTSRSEQTTTKMRRLRHAHQLFKHDPDKFLRVVHCHSSGSVDEFVGDIEGVSSTWKPRGFLKEHQDGLPRQPVPPLTQTMNRFLDSIRPVVNDDKYNYAIQLTKEFSKPGGEGEKLQTLLQQRAATMENWLADYWISAAYLAYRDPVSVFVNPSFVGPYMKQYSDDTGQIRCGALAVSSVLEYKAQVDSQTLAIEKIAGVPQCMIQYYHVLGTTRIPGEKIDRVVTHHGHEPDAPRHITVMCNNNIFHVDVLDENYHPLNVEQIEKQLEDVIHQSQTRVTPVGALTNHYRDKWYQMYTELQKDPQNSSNLQSINRSLFLLCLDECPPGYHPDRHYDCMLPVHMAGGGLGLNTGNRWCDKLLQLIVNKNGTFGFTYEHSVAEGPPILDIILKSLKTLTDNPPPRPSASGGYSKPQKLEFNLTSSLKSSIEEAGTVIDGICRKVDFKMVHFTNYGRDFAKNMKFSPDGFVQAQIQLAYYKMYGHLVSTYESGSLRKFRLGRTETIRSASIPVLKWCQAMSDKGVSAADKVKLLHEAVQHHRWYTSQVSLGQAVDRHLLGLKLIAMENNMEIPTFLKDPIYTQSVHWNLSTTTVPVTIGLVTFSPVVEDGYGIYYNAQKSFLDFGMTAWNTCPTTDVNKLAECLEAALMDTYDVCSQVPKL